MCACSPIELSIGRGKESREGAVCFCLQELQYGDIILRGGRNPATLSNSRRIQFYNRLERNNYSAVYFHATFSFSVIEGRVKDHDL